MVRLTGPESHHLTISPSLLPLHCNASSPTRVSLLRHGEWFVAAFHICGGRGMRNTRLLALAALLIGVPAFAQTAATKPVAKEQKEQTKQDKKDVKKETKAAKKDEAKSETPEHKAFAGATAKALCSGVSLLASSFFAAFVSFLTSFLSCLVCSFCSFATGFVAAVCAKAGTPINSAANASNLVLRIPRPPQM